MRSSPNGLTDDEEAAEVEQGIFPLPMEGIAEDDDDDDWSFTPNLQAKFLFPGDNNDGHNYTEHQRPSTSESCARGDDKRTRTSTNVDQSNAGDDDSNPSCNGEEEEALRQQQEGLFASLVVGISLNHVTNIVETLLRGNARPCLRMLHFREHLRYGKAANLSFEAGIVCDVNHIDNSLLQELLKFCQGVEINGAQDEPVICCVNHDSKLLHYRGRDGSSATRELCTYGDCAMLKDGKRFCRTHKKVKNRRTDSTDSTDNNECNLVDFCRDNTNKPLLHQLAHKLLIDLATPQQKVVVDLLRKDCEDAVGKTSRGNIFIDLDGIPKQVLELLCLKMDDYYTDSEKYRIGSLLGIEQQSLEDEEKYKKMYLRSISIRRDFKRNPDGTLGGNIINEDGVLLKNIKNAPRKKSDKEDAQTNHPSSDPRKCSMQTRIALTTPLPLREYQMRMTSDGVMRQSAEDALKCISGIKDNAMRKSAFDAYREKVGKRNNEPLTVEDIAKVIQANVMKHRVLGRVACPALELLYQAFTQDEYKTLLKIVPTNELPRLVKGKYADEPEVLGEFAVMIHNPGEFIEKCMSQLWGHMDLRLFANSFDRSDCKVSFQMKKTKFPYICIINNSFTSDPDSLVGNNSIEELNVELKAMKAKEKVQLEKEKKMMGEVILLKARVAELEGSLGVTGADVTVDTSSTDEEGKEVTDEPSAITPQNSHAVILTNKRIPKKSYAREQAAAAASSSVELHVTPGSHTPTVAEPVGTLLHSGGDGANTDLADDGVQIQNHSLVPSRNMFGGDSSLRDSIRGGGGHAPGRGGNLRPQYAPNSRGGGGRGGGHAPGRGGNLRPQYAPSSRGGGGRGGGGHAPSREGNRPPNAPIHGRGGGYAPIRGGRGNAPVRGQYRLPHSVPSRGEGGYHSVDHTSAPRGSGYGNGSSNNKSSLQEHGHGASYGGGGRRRVGKIVKVFGHRGYGFINSDEILGSDGKQKDIFFTLERKIFDHIQDKDWLRGSLVSFVLEYENSGKTKATLLKFVEEPN